VYIIRYSDRRNKNQTGGGKREMIEQNNNNIGSKTAVITVLFVIVIYTFLILFTDPYLRLSADSTLYLNIAEKYLKGDIRDAVNGYWGPLLSWLLIPFLYLGFSDVFAINSIYVIFGIATIFGVWRLSYRFNLTKTLRIWVLISLIPIMGYYSFIQPFDLLLLCFLVYYLNIIFNNDYPQRIEKGILGGLIGSLAYLTKSYAFPFFIIHFLSMNIFHYIRDKKEGKNILRNAVVSLIVFSIISGAWIGVISNKYGHLTFSNMGKTNLAIVGPGVPQSGGLEFGQPMFYRGFIEPPNKTAISAWEDPSYIEVETWDPLGSAKNFKHFIKLILKNFVTGLQIFESFSTLSITIIIGYMLLLIQKPFSLKKIISRSDILYPLFTVFLYTGGYLLFHFEARYLWIVNILLLLMGGHLLCLLLDAAFFENSTRRNILIFFFVVSFIFIPSYRVISISKGNLDKRMYSLSKELKKYNIDGNIASNRECVPVHDAWHKTFRLAYWLNSRYYGQAREGISDKELGEEFKKYNIDYYFVWGNLYSNAGLLSRYKEITRGELSGLKIFSLKGEKE
jgi:hypothetical protein